MLSIKCRMWDRKEEYWVPTLKILTEAILGGRKATRVAHLPEVSTKNEWIQAALPLEIEEPEKFLDMHDCEISHGDVVRIITPAFMGRAIEFTALVEKRRKGFCFSAVDMRFATPQACLFGGGYKEIVGSLPA